jgi:hypothetical protein
VKTANEPFPKKSDIPQAKTFIVEIITAFPYHLPSACAICPSSGLTSPFPSRKHAVHRVPLPNGPLCWPYRTVAVVPPASYWVFDDSRDLNVSVTPFEEATMPLGALNPWCGLKSSRVDMRRRICSFQRYAITPASQRQWKSSINVAAAVIHHGLLQQAWAQQVILRVERRMADILNIGMDLCPVHGRYY